MSGSRLKRYLVAAGLAGIGAILLAWLAEAAIGRLPQQPPAIVCEPSVVVLAIDRSLSMIEDPIDGVTKLQRVQQAVGRFVARAAEDQCAHALRVGLVTFARDATLDLAPTSEFARLESAVNSIIAVGGTEIELGIASAANALGDAQFGAWRRVIYVLTDADNFSSDEARLRAALRDALGRGVEVRVLATEPGPHLDVFEDELEPGHVLFTGDAAMGETFFSDAEAVVFRKSVIAPERHRLATALWTGLITAGIALALIVDLNRFNRRRRLLTLRELAAVLGAGVLGLAVGHLVQTIAESGVFAAFWSSGPFGNRGTYGDLFTWALIGIFLTLGLAALRIVPNRSVWGALGFGVIGGLIAGIAFAAVLELRLFESAASGPRLAAAAVLGVVIGLTFTIFGATSIQFPIWLRVHYRSDNVYRYHPIGTTPLSVGSAASANVYVRSDHDIVWRFWIAGSHIVVDNVAAGRRRELSFADVPKRGSIDLHDMTLKIVDDLGPEKGRSS